MKFSAFGALALSSSGTQGLVSSHSITVRWIYAAYTAWGGGEIFTIVHPTVMGRSLVQACQLDEEKI